MCDSPLFRVRMGSSESEWKVQERGIRQGCPLSPYLFGIVMHALMKDVESTDHGNKPMKGLTYNHLMYADDTVIFGSKRTKVQAMLVQIERIARQYGLALSRAKCQHVAMNCNKCIRFSDGQVMTRVIEATYLGCTISEKMTVGKEISKRIRNCMAVWKRLGIYGKSARCAPRVKLQVYQAVISSKLTYGLESLQLNQEHQRRLDAFQLKGLRQILKITTTYINREHTNEYVYKRASEAISHREPKTKKRKRHKRNTGKQKSVIPVSQAIQLRAVKLLGHTIREPQDEPTRQATFKNNSIRPNVHRKKKGWSAQDPLDSVHGGESVARNS